MSSELERNKKKKKGGEEEEEVEEEKRKNEARPRWIGCRKTVEEKISHSSKV